MRSVRLLGLLRTEEGRRFSQELASPLLASRSSARSLLFSAADSVPASVSTDSRWSFLHFLTHRLHRLRHQVVGVRHFCDSPTLIDHLADHSLLAAHC